jgi:hypothetical protein
VDSMSPEKDDLFPSLVEWLCALAPDTTLLWSSDTVGEDFHHVLCDWADIQVPQAEEELRINWVWSIFLTDKPTPSASETKEAECCNLALPEEGYALLSFKSDKPHLSLACYRECNAIPLNKSEVSYLSRTRPLEIDGLKVHLQKFIRVESVSAALSEWVMLHTDRSDINFLFDPSPEPSPLMERVAQRIERAREGSANMVEMKLDDPVWISEILDCPIEEAQEFIKASEEESVALCARLDQEEAEARERARKLLARFS